MCFLVQKRNDILTLLSAAEMLLLLLLLIMNCTLLKIVQSDFLSLYWCCMTVLCFMCNMQKCLHHEITNKCGE